MTNANVLALNIMQKAPAKGTGKELLKGVLDGSSKGNFDEALGRLQREAQNELTSAGRDDTPQGKDTGDGGSGREGASHNPLAMVMALPVQQSALEEAPIEEPAAVVELAEDVAISGETIETAGASAKEEVATKQNYQSQMLQGNETPVKSEVYQESISQDLSSRLPQGNEPPVKSEVYQESISQDLSSRLLQGNELPVKSDAYGESISQEFRSRQPQGNEPLMKSDVYEESSIKQNLWNQLLQSDATPVESEGLEEVSVKPNLRSILPQNDEEAVKTRDFLAMLSGDLTSRQRAEGRKLNHQQVPVIGANMLDSSQKTDRTYFQARNQQLLWQAGTVKEPQDPLGLALKQAARLGEAALGLENTKEEPQGARALGNTGMSIGTAQKSGNEEAATLEHLSGQDTDKGQQAVHSGDNSRADFIISQERTTPGMALRQDRGVGQQIDGQQLKDASGNSVSPTSKQMALQETAAAEPLVRHGAGAGPQSGDLSENIGLDFQRPDGRQELQGPELYIRRNVQQAGAVSENTEQQAQQLVPRQDASAAESFIRQDLGAVQQNEATKEPGRARENLGNVEPSLQRAEPARHFVPAVEELQGVRQPEKVSEKIAANSPQIQLAAEAGTDRKEGLHAVWGNNTASETEESLQPLRVMQNQAQQGENSFRQNQERRNPDYQGEFSAAALQNEEVAAPAAPVAADQGIGVAQLSFQQHFHEAAPVESQQLSAQTAQPDYGVPDQIVEQARLIRSGENTEMVIHLKPEHLGDLTLKISVTENGAVTASFHSDNAQVRTIIENSLVQLRQELSDQGLKVDSVEVFSGLPDGQLPQGQGQQAWQQGSGGRFAGERKPEDYAEEADDLATAALAQEQENLADDGVDYRV